MEFSATKEGNELVIRIPLQQPEPSTSGKTLIVAKTGGNKETNVEIDGQKVYVGVSAYIYPKKG